MTTVEFLVFLIACLAVAVFVIVALSELLIDHLRAADLQDRINRARWPNKE